MFHRSIVLFAALALAACGGKAASRPTGSKVSSTTKSNAANLKSQKPATATKTSTLPKATPAAKTAGSTTVTAPELASGGEFETWSFTDVDLDGDGTGETGVIAADEQNLLAWFSGAAESSGSTVSYEAVVWVVPSGVGFVFDFGASGSFACAETASGASGCVACNGDSCSEVGTDSDGSTAGQ